MNNEYRYMVAPVRKGRTLRGIAAPFNSESKKISDKRGNYNERIKPGAFKRCLASGRNIRALLNHDANQELGSTDNGQLSLWENDQGLAFELRLKPSQERVLSNTIVGCSFSFIVAPGGEDWITKGGVSSRVLTAIDIDEISLILAPMEPAYNDTLVSLDLTPDQQTQMRAMRTKQLLLEIAVEQDRIDGLIK